MPQDELHSSTSPLPLYMGTSSLICQLSGIYSSVINKVIIRQGLAIGFTLFAIRSTRQASTKYSPIELYGFKPILPVDIEHGKFVRTDDFEMENDAELVVNTIFNEMKDGRDYFNRLTVTFKVHKSDAANITMKSRTQRSLLLVSRFY